MLWFAPAAAANVLHVTSPADSGNGSLRKAVTDAASGDVIVIDAGVDPILTSGQIVLNKSLAIQGQGAPETILTADNDPSPPTLFRAFSVTSGAVVSIADLTISGGRAPPGAMSPSAGGGAGANGGAILNDATLLLNRVTVSFNKAGNGGLGSTTGGAGGSGGGIYSTGSGPLTILNSRIAGNFAGDAGTGFNGDGGIGGSGGGIYSTGPTTILNTTVLNNQAGTGGSSIFAGRGRGGDAGGIGHATGGNLFIESSTISGNLAGSGSAGAPVEGGPGGSAGGNGGGVSSSGTGAFTLLNSTVFNNFGGAGGPEGSADPFPTPPSTGGAGGNGGGIHFDGSAGIAMIVSSTIVKNHAGLAGVPGPADQGQGGGVFTAGTPLATTVRNSILAANTALPVGSNGPNCAGVAISNVYPNWGYPADAMCPPGFVTSNPLLDPFGPRDNGGPTRTIALFEGSPAIDQVVSCTDSTGAPLTIDQRGLPRPFGAACDAGAFEVQPPPTLPGTGKPASGLKKQCCGGGKCKKGKRKKAKRKKCKHKKHKRHKKRNK